MPLGRMVIIGCLILTLTTWADEGPLPVREAPAVLAGGSGGGIGRLVPDLEFRNIRGESSRLIELSGTNGTVIAFTSTSCPVTKRYVATLRELEQDYGEKGFPFIFVNPIATDSPEAGSFAGPYVQDGKNVIGASLGARTTAEAGLLALRVVA